VFYQPEKPTYRGFARYLSDITPPFRLGVKIILFPLFYRKSSPLEKSKLSGSLFYEEDLS